MSHYVVVLADPPWSYGDKAAAGKRGAAFQYPCMRPRDIRDLAVNQIIKPNALLFLWSTFPMIETALTVFQPWGFVYKTAAFVWVKSNKNTTGYKIGMGHWTRQNAEVCLLGVRGSPKRQSASVRQIIEAPEPEVINTVPGRHSTKPIEVRDRIVELCGDVPRIELFARGSPAPGWDYWGEDAPQPQKDLL